MQISWLLCGILFMIVILLGIKIWLLKKDMNEICIELMEHLSDETNRLLSTSSKDPQVRDIAVELNKALHILRRKRQQYANGNRELKEAVTSLSHDLRTPLTAISGYLDLLKQEEVSPAVERYLGIIRNRVTMLEYLIEELFRYSIIMAYENHPLPKQVVVNEVLEESIAEFYTILKERSIVPQIQMPEIKVIRYLDRASLSRVFSNILSNVMKYSEGDFAITMTAEGVITFQNTAYGLNEVEVANLFHRFYTVESAKKSTGLGLAIAQNLMKQMNGTISASYEQNTFIVRLELPECKESERS